MRTVPHSDRLSYIAADCLSKENERMHLLTFLTLRKPSIWFRALILGAQGLWQPTFRLDKA